MKNIPLSLYLLLFCSPHLWGYDFSPDYWIPAYQRRGDPIGVLLHSLERDRISLPEIFSALETAQGLGLITLSLKLIEKGLLTPGLTGEEQQKLLNLARQFRGDEDRIVKGAETLTSEFNEKFNLALKAIELGDFETALVFLNQAAKKNPLDNRANEKVIELIEEQLKNPVQKGNYPLLLSLQKMVLDQAYRRDQGAKTLQYSALWQEREYLRTGEIPFLHKAVSLWRSLINNFPLAEESWHARAKIHFHLDSDKFINTHLSEQ